MPKKIRLIFFLLLLCFFPMMSFANTLPDGAEYLYLGGSTRSQALGGSGLAELDTIGDVGLNPAALGDIRRVANSVNFGGFGSDFLPLSLGFAYPTLVGNFSGQLIYQSSEGGVNTFKNLLQLNAAISKAITKDFFFGFSMKAGYADLGGSGDWNLGADIGVIYRINSDEGSGFGFFKPTLGVALKNLGKTVTNATTSSFPGFGLGAGLSFYPLMTESYKIKLLTDAYLVTDFPTTETKVGAVWTLGLEQTLADFIDLRAGLNLSSYGLPMYSVGAGINAPVIVQNATTDVKLSYALTIDTAGTSPELVHFASIEVAWGSYDDKAPEAEITASESYFSPNFDDSQDELVLTFDVKDNTLVDGWEVEVLDSEGNVIRTYKSVNELGVSDLSVKKFFKQIFSKKESVEIPESIVWDGQNSDGDVVSDGVYSYVLKSWDENNNISETTAGTVVIDTVVPTVSAEADFVLFSPNGDGAKDSLTFSLKSANVSDGDILTAKLLDEDGNSVRSYSFSNSAPDEIIWDGLDEGGALVSEGNYEFVVTVKDFAGNSTTEKLSELRLVTAYQTVEADVNNLEFSPNADGDMDKIVYKPSVSDTEGLELWALVVSDSVGNAVRMISGDGELPEEIVFDGKDQSGNILEDGEYTLRLDLLYDSGNYPSSEVLTVTLDNTPAEGSISAEYLEFSPNWDGNRDTITFTHDFIGNPEDVIKATIEDEYGNLIYYGKYDFEDFPESFEWDGLDRNLNPLSEGTYVYKIETEDSVGNTAEISVENILLKTGLEQAKVQSDVLAVSPGNDNANSKAIFSPVLTSTDEITEMKLMILDADQNPVKTFTENSYASSIEWDGSDESGNPVPDGTYSYYMSVKYSYGDEPVSPEKTITVDTVAPSISLSVNHMVFSPNDDGNQETVTITPTATGGEDDVYSLTVYNEDDEVVDSYEWNGKVPDEIVWDGEGLPEGYYTFKVRGEDEAGNATEKKIAGVKLVRTFETLEFTSESMQVVLSDDRTPTPLEFNAEVSSLDGLEDVELCIINSSGEKVRTITSLSGGSLLWDGLDDDGEVVSDGKYDAKLTFSYDSGNVISKTIEDITVDVTPPQVSLVVSPDLFTPDDDGENDTFFINVVSADSSGVASWEVNIYKKTDDWENSTPIKTYSGEGAIAQVIEWDGLSDDGDLVESVQDYVLVFEATDGMGNRLEPIEKEISVGVLVEITDEGVKIRVSSVTFASASSELTDDGKETLDKVIYIIRKILSDPGKYDLGDDYNIEVSGHTDDRGTEAYNLTLSESRAKAVYDYLIEQNVSSDILSYIGYGESQPYKEITDDLDADKKSEYRAMNRRVEFFIRN